MPVPGGGFARKAGGAELSPYEARELFWQLRQRKSNSTIWPSHNARRPRLARRRMMRETARTPLIAMHIASLVIQRTVRGYLLRLSIGTSNSPHLPKASKRTAAAAQAFKTVAVAEGGGMGSMSPEDAAAAKLAKVQATELKLVARYLEAKVRYSGVLSDPENEEVQFNDWILLRLQAFARMIAWRCYHRSLRNVVSNAAATSIQRARQRATWSRRPARRRSRPHRGAPPFSSSAAGVASPTAASLATCVRCCSSASRAMRVSCSAASIRARRR